MDDEAFPQLPLAEMPPADILGESPETRAAREDAVVSARRALRSADVELAQLERLVALVGKAADDCARTGRIDAAAKWREALNAVREGRGLASVRMLRTREALAAVIEGWGSGAHTAYAAIHEDKARVEDIWTRLDNMVKDIRRMQEDDERRHFPRGAA